MEDTKRTFELKILFAITIYSIKLMSMLGQMHCYLDIPSEGFLSGFQFSHGGV